MFSTSARHPLRPDRRKDLKSQNLRVRRVPDLGEQETEDQVGRAVKNIDAIGNDTPDALGFSVLGPQSPCANL